MSRQFHVAVLECDTLLEPVLSERGNWAGIFGSNLQSSLQNLGYLGRDIDLTVSSWDVVGAQVYPNVHEIDCLLLSGGKHNAYSNDPWILKLVNFVSNVYEYTSIPLIGICFGHQTIARALGATVCVNPNGWEVSAEQVELTDEGAGLFGVNSLTLYQTHRDMVLAPAPGVRNIGYSDRCGVQICYQPGRIFTIQAHPEFDSWMMHHILVWVKDIFVDEASYLDAHARADMHCDGELVFTAFWKFLLDARANEDNVRAVL